MPVQVFTLETGTTLIIFLEKTITKFLAVYSYLSFSFASFSFGIPPSRCPQIRSTPLETIKVVIYTLRPLLGELKAEQM